MAKLKTIPASLSRIFVQFGRPSQRSAANQQARRWYDCEMACRGL